MSKEFSVPLTREELMRDDGHGSYTVTELLSPPEITCRIDGKIRTGGFFMCNDHHSSLQIVSLCLLKEGLGPLKNVFM